MLAMAIAFHLGAAAAFFVCAASVGPTPGSIRTRWIRLVVLCLAWPITVLSITSSRWTR